MPPCKRNAQFNCRGAAARPRQKETGQNPESPQPERQVSGTLPFPPFFLETHRASTHPRLPYGSEGRRHAPFHPRIPQRLDTDYRLLTRLPRHSDRDVLLVGRAGGEEGRGRVH